MNNEVQRNFILGDTWLYYKIYAGAKTADSILTQVIKPVAEKLLENEIIEKWFYIRYADPKQHLRVRFNYRDPGQVGSVINALYPHFKAFVADDLIWKIQTDTYQREINRYGTNTMELSEEIFYHDSSMMVGFFDLIEGDEGEEVRWLFSLKAMDSFLDSCQYEGKGKLIFLEHLKTAYGNEFGMSRALKKQLDNKYRMEREKIERFMALSDGDSPEVDPVLALIKRKEENIAKTISEVLSIKESKGLLVEWDALVSSYLHMLMNRLFKSKNRLHEMVCYDFLYRYHKSVLARKKHRDSLKEV